MLLRVALSPRGRGCTGRALREVRGLRRLRRGVLLRARAAGSRSASGALDLGQGPRSLLLLVPLAHAPLPLGVVEDPRAVLPRRLLQAALELHREVPEHLLHPDELLPLGV